MKLEEKLISLSEYGISFRTYKNNFIITITYSDGWSVIKPSDEKIKFLKDKDNANTYYYATEVNSDMTHLEGIFNTIDETISYNKEIEEKTLLLKSKIDELSKLFVDTPIADLKRLEFVIPPQKKASTTRKKKETDEKKEEKPKQTRKKKETPEKVTEETNTESEFDKKIKMSIERVNKNKQQTEVK